MRNGKTGGPLLLILQSSRDGENSKHKQKCWCLLTLPKNLEKRCILLFLRSQKIRFSYLLFQFPDPTSRKPRILLDYFHLGNSVREHEKPGKGDDLLSLLSLQTAFVWSHTLWRAVYWSKVFFHSLLYMRYARPTGWGTNFCTQGLQFLCRGGKIPNDISGSALLLIVVGYGATYFFVHIA